MSEEKKKMYYYYGGKEKKAGEVKKEAEGSMIRFGAMPSVDLEDRGKDFRLAADLPGFKKEDVEIEVADDSVVIQAKRTLAEEEKQKNYVRKERSSQTFYRRVHLPENVRSDDAKASLNNGILEIILPKKEPKETKKLTIV